MSEEKKANSAGNPDFCGAQISLKFYPTVTSV